MRPLDIVDISEQTMLKLKKKIKTSNEKRTRNKGGFQPWLSQNQNHQNLVKKIMQKKRKN